MSNFTWQFGERFRQIRRMTRLTQEEFGELVNVSRQTINAYENDRQRPPIAMMEKVCQIHGVSPRWILTGLGEPKADPAYQTAEEAVHGWSAGKESLSPEQVSLVKFIAEDRERAVKLTHYLLDKALKYSPTEEGTEPSEEEESPDT